MYSINVLIVTYNQEQVIGRALDSILCQKEYGLNKIIICDDCSTDHNWDVIQDYYTRFPEIIVPYRSSENKGRSRMYDNFERSHELRGKADLYTELAGDDAYCDGWFKTVQEFIINNNIDIKNEAVTIFCNYKTIYPDGRKLLNTDNKLVKNNQLSLVSLKTRSLISGRGSLSSKKVYDRFKPVILDEGLPLAEDMFDSKKFENTDKAYYCDYIGSVYFAAYGVSADLEDNPIYKDIIHACIRRKEVYVFSKKDDVYWDFQRAKYEFLLSPTIKGYNRIIGFYIKSFSFSYSKHSIKRDFRLFASFFKKLIKQQLYNAPHSG